MATSSSNIFRLRAGVIGSMSAWLPSRRSTEHHCGACVMTFDGQVRSGRSMGGNAEYRENGMGDGCWMFLTGSLVSHQFGRPGMVSSATRVRPVSEALVAAAKEEVAAPHVSTVSQDGHAPPPTLPPRSVSGAD